MSITDEQLNSMNADDLRKALRSLVDDYNKLEEKVNILTERLAVENADRFGRKSEKNRETAEENGQLSLFNETEAVADLEAKESTIEEVVPSYKRKRPVGKKQQDLSKFPHKQIDYEIPEEQLAEIFPEGYECQKEPETYERLVYKPAEYYVEEHRVHVYRSRTVSGKFVRASYPKSLLRGSIVTPSLAAAIINGKYTNAIPLNRIEQEFARNDIHISRQTMANWMIRLTQDYLSVIYGRMKECMLTVPVLQADETVLKVREDTHDRDKNYMWVYRTAPTYPEKPVILYQYRKSREEGHPEEFLKGFSGILQTDGYTVYHQLTDKVDSIVGAGCWAHARRRFADTVKAGKKGLSTSTAEEALRRIQKIYNADKQLAGLPFEEIASRRRLEVAPLVDSFFEWVKQAKATTLVKSKTGEGLKYCLNQETYLRTFLERGDVPIDNNATEQAIRPFTIGRKNWVMIDTVNGAETSATLYSLVETAKANNLRIYEYLEYLLTEIPKRMDEPISSLDDLLPWADNLPDYCRKPSVSKDNKTE